MSEREFFTPTSPPPSTCASARGVGARDPRRRLSAVPKPRGGFRIDLAGSWRRWRSAPILLGMALLLALSPPALAQHVWIDRLVIGSGPDHEHGEIVVQTASGLVDSMPYVISGSGDLAFVWAPGATFLPPLELGVEVLELGGGGCSPDSGECALPQGWPGDVGAAAFSGAEDAAQVMAGPLPWIVGCMAGTATAVALCYLTCGDDGVSAYSLGICGATAECFCNEPPPPPPPPPAPAPPGPSPGECPPQWIVCDPLRWFPPFQDGPFRVVRPWGL
jgi:hypothetical protein